MLLIEIPRQLVERETRQLDFTVAVGDPPLHRLTLGERRTEGAAQLGLLDHHFQAARGQPHAGGGDLQPPQAKPALQRREGFAHHTQHLIVVRFDIVEMHGVRGIVADHRIRGGHRDARLLGVKQKRGHAAARPLGGIGPRDHDHKIGVARVCDKNLAAVQ